MPAQKNVEGMSAYLEKLAQELPGVMKAFHQLREAVFSDGALSAKQKELVAVGIAVAIRCAPCIVNHVTRAVQAGATEREILEAASVAVVMGGGPALAYAAEALKVLEALRGEGGEK